MNRFIGVLENEPAESYHAKREYISSSPLPAMRKSPLHFLREWTNPVDEPTATMDKGTFMHSLLLEQDIAKFCPRPLKDDGSLVRSNSKEYAAFLAANQGKTPIPPDLYAEAMAILNSACSNRRFMRDFEMSKKEVSFYGRHEETGLYLKARADMVPNDFSFLGDLKSTADMTRFNANIYGLGYHIRLVHYAETIKAATGHEIPDDQFYFYAIESSDPYGMMTFRLPVEDVRSARAQWQIWMNEIGTCVADDKWPGYSERVVESACPKYLQADTEILFAGAV